MRNIIFIHGLESSGKGFKGRFLKKIFPEIITPDFEPYNPNQNTLEGLLYKRLVQLRIILDKKEKWIIIGSSFGGLIGATYTFENPKKVKILILLAPFFGANLFNPKNFNSIDVPVKIFHGKKDFTAPIKDSKPISDQLFSNLEYIIVDDDHFLHKTVKEIKWRKLVENYE
jgi:pimeloyl-ACP methyl ester carboxylesterase